MVASAPWPTGGKARRPEASCCVPGLMANQDTVPRIRVAEQGTPIAESHSEVAYAAGLRPQAPDAERAGSEESQRGVGGNAPFIVSDGAGLDSAVADAIVSKFRNAGQTCMCASHLHAQAGICDDLGIRT